VKILLECEVDEKTLYTLTEEFHGKKQDSKRGAEKAEASHEQKRSGSEAKEYGEQSVVIGGSGNTRMKDHSRTQYN